MKTDRQGKIKLCGIGGFDNPLDSATYPKRLYAEGKESARISFRRIWVDRYMFDSCGRFVEYWSCELKLLSNGKCFLDGREIKDKDEIENVNEIFTNLKL